MGTFRIGLHSLHSLHSLHCFLLLRERGILIDHPTLVDTQPASSPCAIKTVNLTIIKSQSQARLVHDTAIGGPTARPQAFVDQTVDQNTPVAGTRMRHYPCFVGLMRWVVSCRRNHHLPGAPLNQIIYI